MQRAYALLEVKSIGDGPARVFAGIASTPELDRQGEIVDPASMRFRNPVPLLLHHDQTLPIGTAILTATPEGIVFEATLAAVDEAGPLKTRVDDAWQCIKAGVIRGVSIGHLAGAAVSTFVKGARRLTNTEVCELSLVTIPANANATIRLVKSLAAPPRQEQRIMAEITAAEHVTNLSNKRAAHVGRMAVLMKGAAEANENLGEDEAKEHDGLALEVKALDADLARWRSLEQLQITTATPVAPASPTYPHISVRANVEPGLKLARFVIAKMMARYEGCDASQYAAARWNDSTPEVALALKAAVTAGSTTDATWAKPLVNPSVTEDFLPLLRAATILGKIPGLYNVPFNVQVPSQTAGAAINWVGELKPKPVSAMAFASDTLTWAKVAAIVVLSQELVRFSNPKAEVIVRNSLVRDIAAFVDAQFINPAVAAVAGVNPASITNGAPTAAATANPWADLLGLINHFAAANISVEGLTFLMSPANALALSFRMNSDGSAQFPGVGVSGGSWKGLTFITSNAVGTNVIALQPGLILFADDGGVTIDASTEASLQMDSAPMTPPDATVVMASMFQMNAVALRAEQFINWKRVNANAVKYLTAAAWPAPAGATALEGNGTKKA